MPCFCRVIETRVEVLENGEYTNFFHVSFSSSYLLNFALRCEIRAEIKSVCVSEALFGYDKEASVNNLTEFEF